MRTKIIRVKGVKYPYAILVARVRGFKLYDANGTWILKTAKSTELIAKTDPRYNIVSQYAILRYQPRSIEQAFRSILDAIK